MAIFDLKIGYVGELKSNFVAVYFVIFYQHFKTELICNLGLVSFLRCYLKHILTWLAYWTLTRHKTESKEKLPMLCFKTDLP